MNKRNVFIFSGAPGAGKGSLARLCVSKLGFEQISTGDLCRQHIAKQTEIGKKIDFIIKSGKLIPNDLVTKMVLEWFFEHDSDDATVILDGYPRTVGQAEAFRTLTQDGTLPVDVVVVKFAIDDEIVVNRLGSRQVCQNKACQAVYSTEPDAGLSTKKQGICDICGHSVGTRKDDMPEVVRNRLRLFHLHEQELLRFYETVGYKIIDIDANEPLNNMFDQFQRQIQ